MVEGLKLVNMIRWYPQQDNGPTHKLAHASVRTWNQTLVTDMFKLAMGLPALYTWIKLQISGLV
jgi:hypothetical protein